MIELVFVIVVIGIIGKFGLEFIAQAYKHFIFSKINHTLQTNSTLALELITSRLKFRIKDSLIVRDSTNANLATNFTSLKNVVTTNKNKTILEWVGYDIEGFRGVSLSSQTINFPNWSGIIDINASNKTKLSTPNTDISEINDIINILSKGRTSISDTAIYFDHATTNNNIKTYGWNGIALSEQSTASMHPITGISDNIFTSSNGDDFAKTEIYEYYKLAWTAYALVHSEDGNLTLYYDYQPWNGENYLANGKKSLMMENISSFKFKAINSMIQVKICVESNLVEEYFICKEKIID
jgi:hypothetical protein